MSNMKSSVIRIRLDDELLETIRRLANANERTIAKQIQYTLKQSFKGETK
jgi:hypothetical protein